MRACVRVCVCVFACARVYVYVNIGENNVKHTIYDNVKTEGPIARLLILWIKHIVALL